MEPYPASNPTFRGAELAQSLGQDRRDINYEVAKAGIVKLLVG
jgi:hypothetical protein